MPVLEWILYLNSNTANVGKNSFNMTFYNVPIPVDVRMFGAKWMRVACYSTWLNGNVSSVATGFDQMLSRWTIVPAAIPTTDQTMTPIQQSYVSWILKSATPNQYAIPPPPSVWQSVGFITDYMNVDLNTISNSAGSTTASTFQFVVQLCNDDSPPLWRK